MHPIIASANRGGVGASVDGPSPAEAGALKEASMSDTHNTTVHTAEVVRYDDPVIITERVAVSAFIAGTPTRQDAAMRPTCGSSPAGATTTAPTC